MKERSINEVNSPNSLGEGVAPTSTVAISESTLVTISAWMDGDEQTNLPSELFTESGHATWQVYHLIGDTLRTPELALTGQADLSQRVAQALAAEPALSAAPLDLGVSLSPFGAQPVAEPSQPFRLSKLMRRVIWPSLAMAAAVASVVWVAKPLLVPELSLTAVQTAKADQAHAPAASNQPSPMLDYVTAHRQISGPSNVRHASFGVPRE